MSQDFSPGDRILTASGRPGTVEQPAWSFPGHWLIAFDSGEIYWVRSELLEPLPADWKPAKKTQKRGLQREQITKTSREI